MYLKKRFPGWLGGDNSLKNKSPNSGLEKPSAQCWVKMVFWHPSEKGSRGRKYHLGLAHNLKTTWVWSSSELIFHPNHKILCQISSPPLHMNFSMNSSPCLNTHTQLDNLAELGSHAKKNIGKSKIKDGIRNGPYQLSWCAEMTQRWQREAGKSPTQGESEC